MVNYVLYQNWFWYKIIDNHGDWKNLLTLRIINKEIKQFIDKFLINTRVIKPVAGRRFIQINKCDSCGKIGNNFHQLHFKEYVYPVSVIILCDHWKCRYSGLISYCNEFKENNKYVCYKKLPLQEQEYIPRSKGVKTLSYVSPYFLKKIKNKFHVFCYWYDNFNSYTKYVPIEEFKLRYSDKFLLEIVYHNKYFDCENITLLELFEREW